MNPTPPVGVQEDAEGQMTRLLNISTGLRHNLKKNYGEFWG